MKKHTLKRVVFYIFLAAVVLFVFAFGKNNKQIRTLTTVDYLDTVCDISVVSRSDRPLKVCEDYLKQAHSEFDINSDSSSITAFNRGASSYLSDDFSELLSFGADFSQKHSEYFSVYLEPVIKKWNIKENTGVIPSISDALTAASSHATVDFGAVAKGFITDKLVIKLKNAGVSSALINLGGNAYAMGKKPTGELWQIGIQDPKDENNIIGIISAENLAVITSGDYQRFFELDGKRYHHILDPKTGFPAESAVHSVTVIHENAALSDALSTAAFVAGIEKGSELLKEYGAMGIFITDDTVYFSKELESIFKQTDFSYKYKFIY